MSKTKTAVLLTLWVLLALRVVSLIAHDRGWDWSLTALAIFAWCGGLVSELLYNEYRGYKEQRRYEQQTRADL